MPIAIEMTVSSIVTTTPWRMRGSKKKSPNVPHPKRGFVATECTAIATRSRTTARRHPAPRVAHRDGLDLLGRVPWPLEPCCSVDDTRPRA